MNGQVSIFDRDLPRERVKVKKKLYAGWVKKLSGSMLVNNHQTSNEHEMS